MLFCCCCYYSVCCCCCDSWCCFAVAIAVVIVVSAPTLAVLASSLERLICSAHLSATTPFIPPISPSLCPPGLSNYRCLWFCIGGRGWLGKLLHVLSANEGNQGLYLFKSIMVCDGIAGRGVLLLMLSVMPKLMRLMIKASTNYRRSSNAGLMLSHCCGRWTNIKPIFI